ncbi:MAG: hypothetical protein V3U71_08565 [Cocleimonas sp.]
MKTFAEYLLETKLFEMALNKKKLEDKISNLEYQINQHLIKILAFDDKPNEKKHFKDISGWMNQINSYYLKPNKTKLSSNKYFELLFNDPFEDHIEAIDMRIESLNYNTSRSNLSSKEIYNKIKQFHLLNSKLISDNQTKLHIKL